MGSSCLIILQFILILTLPLLVRSESCNLNCDATISGFQLDGDLSNISMPFIESSTLPSFQEGSNASAGVVIMHGIQRNAKDYFCFMDSALRSFAYVPRTAFTVLAPWFRYKRDQPPLSDSLYWDDVHYKDGANSTENYPYTLSSYEVLDKMLGRFTNKTLFPNLERILVFGHSGGAQFVHRYAVVSRFKIPETEEDGSPSRLKLNFGLANPSSFVYFSDTRRPVLPSHFDCMTYCVNSSLTRIVSAKLYDVSQSADASSCPSYQSWPLGFGSELPPYVTLQFQDENYNLAKVLLHRYASRDILYVAGGADVCNSDLACPQTPCYDNNLAKDCGAMLQGRCRLQRGILYHSFLQKLFEENEIPLLRRAQHHMIYASDVPHDSCTLLMHPVVKRKLFGWN